MNKADVTKFFKGVGNKVSKHSPEILTAVGIAGMVTTTILAVKATPKALQLIEEEKAETPVEKVKVAWKPYIPAATTGIFSVACLIGASSVNARRNAALATAYKLSETALTEYRDKVVEVVGEKKEKTIRDEVAKDRVEKNPTKKTDVIITGKGNTVCMDYLSGRYFTTDIDKIRKAENAINRKIINNMYASLNEFYSELGLDGTPMGEELGWKLDDGKIEIELSAILDENDEPVVVMDYQVAPKHDYYKFA